MTHSTEQNWWTELGHSMTQDAIESCRGSPAYRVSERRRRSGEEDTMIMRRCVVAVLAGQCRFTGPRDCELTAGDVVVLPGGEYELRATGSIDLHLLFCWEIPAEFRRPDGGA
jgi:hypothetical protein